MKKYFTIKEPNVDFLPDFCNGPTVFNVVVLAEMLAVVITVVSARISPNPLKDLFLISIFVQWIALASAAVLCLARRYLNRLPPLRTVIMAYLILLCVTWVVGELILWLMWAVGMIDSPHPQWYQYFQIQNLTIAGIVDALALRYFFARHQLRQSVINATRAQMEALKYRIRPHFLFNSMNIIASLTRRSPAKAETAIEDMADVFRLMLDETKNLVPVNSEIGVARKYLALEKLRLENRLNVTWNIGEVPRTAKIPVLLLQLLLENAIHFGIEPSPEGGEIQISINKVDDALKLQISNPIPARPEQLVTNDSTTLDNIRQRLRGHYGDEAKLGVRRENERFIVDVELPAYGGIE